MAMNRAAIAKTAMKENLSEKEWKFDSVPPDEIEACFYYEYSREYFKQSHTLQKLRVRWEAYRAWLKAHTHPLRARWQAYQVLQYEYKKSLESGKPPLPKPEPPPPMPLPKYPATPKKHEIGFIAEDYAERILSARQGFATPFDFRTFPAVSWQDLPKRPGRESWPLERGIQYAKQRQQRRKYRGDRFHIETLAQLEPPKIMTFPDWIEYHHWFRRDQDLSHTEYGFFAINWDYPVPEIRRAFSEWLNEQANERKGRPKASPSPTDYGLEHGMFGILGNLDYFRPAYYPSPEFCEERKGEPKRPPSRGQFKDKLRWLGALRVKKHYHYSELVDYPDANLKVEAPYKQYPDLCAAAKKAEHLISKMFPPEKEAAQIASGPLKEFPPLSAEAIDGLKKALASLPKE
jgi:hypothetical protein